jgi:hypothetical protein
MVPSERELQRVRGVTANFFFWQGLRWVPMGVALILIGLGATPGLRLPPFMRGWAPWVAMVIALWLSTSVIGGYYQRTFGSVRGLPGLHARRDTVKWLVVYPALMLALAADAKLEPPVFISGLVFGGGILAYWWSTGRGRPHYLVATTLLCLLAFLPLSGTVPAGRVLIGPFLGVLGIIYVIGGVLDHFELTRIMGPVMGEDMREEENAGAL